MACALIAVSLGAPAPSKELADKRVQQLLHSLGAADANQTSLGAADANQTEEQRVYPMESVADQNQIFPVLMSGQQQCIGNRVGKCVGTIIGYIISLGVAASTSGRAPITNAIAEEVAGQIKEGAANNKVCAGMSVSQLIKQQCIGVTTDCNNNPNGLPCYCKTSLCAFCSQTPVRCAGTDFGITGIPMEAYPGPLQNSAASDTVMQSRAPLHYAGPLLQGLVAAKNTLGRDALAMAPLGCACGWRKGQGTPNWDGCCAGCDLSLIHI